MTAIMPPYARDLTDQVIDLAHRLLPPVETAVFPWPVDGRLTEPLTDFVHQLAGLVVGVFWF